MNVRLAAQLIVGVIVAIGGMRAAAAESVRSDAHEQYATELWEFVQENNYQDWQNSPAELPLVCGPPFKANARHFGNRLARGDANAQPKGAILVTEHYAGEPVVLTAVTVRLKRQPGFDAGNHDWYWIHFSPDGKTVATSADKNPWARPGFAAIEEDGRLWVFDMDSPDLAHYLNDGELAKHVIRPGVGPAGMTLKAPDGDTITRYVAAKPGFVTRLEDGRLWVFRKGSEELAAFDADGELAKHVIRPSAGPLGTTLKSPDAETLDAYLLSKPGFATRVVEGRLWVFREGSDELAEFESNGELAKHVIRPAAGPGGVTIKAPDAETLDAYLTAQPGFVTKFDDGRVWVFRIGCPELKDYEANGELAKHVIRPAAGPGGLTLKAPDADTIDAYLRACAL